MSIILILQVCESANSVYGQGKTFFDYGVELVDSFTIWMTCSAE